MDRCIEAHLQPKQPLRGDTAREAGRERQRNVWKDGTRRRGWGAAPVRAAGKGGGQWQQPALGHMSSVERPTRQGDNQSQPTTARQAGKVEGREGKVWQRHSRGAGTQVGRVRGPRHRHNAPAHAPQQPQQRRRPTHHAPALAACSDQPGTASTAGKSSRPVSPPPPWHMVAPAARKRSGGAVKAMPSGREQRAMQVSQWRESQRGHALPCASAGRRPCRHADGSTSAAGSPARSPGPLRVLHARDAGPTAGNRCAQTVPLQPAAPWG